jgi:hypothetical protein
MAAPASTGSGKTEPHSETSLLEVRISAEQCRRRSSKSNTSSAIKVRGKLSHTVMSHRWLARECLRSSPWRGVIAVRISLPHRLVVIRSATVSERFRVGHALLRNTDGPPASGIIG